MDRSSGPQGWLALVTQGTEARLRPVSLRYRWFPIGNDDPKGPYRGVEINTRPAVEAVVLLKGAGLRAGTVVAASMTGGTDGLTEKRLRLGGRHYVLRGDDACWQVEMLGFTCHWRLREAGRMQTVIKVPVEVDVPPPWTGTSMGGRTSVVWAGDLDADGKLDLILDVPTHHSVVRDLRVFLSSRATANALVGFAGKFLLSGC